VLLNTAATDEIIAELNNYVKVLDTLDEINVVHMRGSEDIVPVLESLPFVEAVSPDAERYGSPVDTVDVENFADGLSTWDLDAINITDTEFGLRVVGEDGTGVYVAVLDTGLLDSWRQYFPQERIATEYAMCFGGGGESGAQSLLSFSSRALSGQDLDVAAPGSWVVGPYQVNSGQTSYYYLGGTSMASPHVAGIAALMAQKDNGITSSEVEAILEGTAHPMAPGSRAVYNPDGSMTIYEWGSDATGAGLVDAQAALDAIP
jgi:hypothetical protein